MSNVVDTLVERNRQHFESNRHPVERGRTMFNFVEYQTMSNVVERCRTLSNEIELCLETLSNVFEIIDSRYRKLTAISIRNKNE